MLFSKVQDNKIRQKLLKFEYKNKVKKFVLLNALSNNTDNNCIKINKTFYKKENFHKALYSSFNTRTFSYKTKIVRHCLFNNRTKSVYKKFNLSRSILRELILFGLMPGYKKAVW